ncbi:uncharacterized protein EV420DRAFT_1748672 [Desarmillaria tabescens]|uniref:Uncharacterized protein n=1 Tax=Armillaria tabescens TaxID=1929756 RepID=A0AA39N464_ARMTA|nr:uncharacterized protein EV420DRAFT_1748672 [Desarmillaria tabescens]KAK0457531.1 hypothetical protein EV420DRAFT_1748672 [Desarmillaria tabescens]
MNGFDEAAKCAATATASMSAGIHPNKCIASYRFCRVFRPSPLVPAVWICVTRREWPRNVNRVFSMSRQHLVPQHILGLRVYRLALQLQEPLECMGTFLMVAFPGNFDLETDWLIEASLPYPTLIISAFPLAVLPEHVTDASVAGGSAATISGARLQSCRLGRRKNVTVISPTPPGRLETLAVKVYKGFWIKASVAACFLYVIHGWQRSHVFSVKPGTKPIGPRLAPSVDMVPSVLLVINFKADVHCRVEDGIGPDAQKIMFLQERLTSIYLTGYIFVPDGLPVRQHSRTSVQRCPYSPPITGQRPPSNVLSSTARPSLPLPGSPPAKQCHHLLCFYPRLFRVHRLIGLLAYGTSFDNDRNRTWTVSSTHLAATRTFSCTKREKPGSAAMEVLVAVVRKVAEVRVALLGDVSLSSLAILVIGIARHFTLAGRATERLTLFEN